MIRPLFNDPPNFERRRGGVAVVVVVLGVVGFLVVVAVVLSGDRNSIEKCSGRIESGVSFWLRVSGDTNSIEECVSLQQCVR